MCSGEECEWLVVVTGECVWVRMDAYGCIGLGKHKKQTRKDTHGSTAHDFPAIVDGKFPKIHVWVRGIQKGPQQVSDGCRWSRITLLVCLSRTHKKNNESRSKNRTTSTDQATKQRRENNNKKWLESNKQNKNESTWQQTKGGAELKKKCSANRRGGELVHAKKY